MKKWVIGGMAALMVLGITVFVPASQANAVQYPPTPTLWYDGK